MKILETQLGLSGLDVHPVKRIDDVLNIALQNPAYGALPVAAK